MNPELLNRREALLRVAQLMGLVLIGGPALLRGQAVARSAGSPAFTAQDLALLDEIGDTIIPATHTPGAKDIGIGAFMAMMVTDCYEPAEQAVFRAGLIQIDEVARQQHGRAFVACTSVERTAFLNGFATRPKPGSAFAMLRQLTLLGYFTSEKGCLASFNYEEVPGRYDGDAPYTPGEKLDFSPPSRS